MRKNFNKIIALSMSVFMVGSMVPAMNVKADSAKAVAVNTVNSEFINGDFEKGLDAWKIHSGSAEVVEEGTSHVLKVDDSAMVENTAWVVKPSTEYVVSYEAKLLSAGTVSIEKVEWDWDGAAGYNQIKKANVTDAATFTTVGSWGKKSYRFTTSDKTTMVQIRIKVDGKALVDNVTFVPSAGIKEHVTTGAEAWKNAEGTQLAECEAKVPTEEVYLLNEDFEDGTSFNKGTLAEEDGNKFVKYTAKNADFQSQHTFSMKAGKEYTVSFKAKLFSGTSHLINVRFTNWSLNYDQACGDLTTDDGWKEYSYKFTPEIDGDFTLMISKWGEAEAEFGIDDFKLSTIENKKKIEYKLNADFEDGTAFNKGTFAEEDGRKFTKYTGINTDFQSQYNLPLEKGVEYTVSFDAKLFSGTSNLINIKFIDWANPDMDYQMPNMASDWTTYSYTIKPTESSTYTLMISKWGEAEAEFGIDNFKVSAASGEDVDPVLTKGGYGKNIGAGGTDGVALMTDDSAYTTLVNVKKGSTYEYGFWYKVVDADNDSNFAPVITFGEDSKTLVEKVENNNGWTYASGTFTATADNATLAFTHTGKGIAYVSGVTVEDNVDVHIHHGKVTAYGATCTEDSKKVYKCADCGNVVYSEYTGAYEGGEKATGHNYKKVKTVAATYTAKGYTEHKCSKCGSVKKDSYTSVKKLAKVKKVKATAKKKALKISWAKATGAKKYEIHVSTKSNFKNAIKKTTTKSSYTVKKLKAKKKYYVRVRAIRTEGKKTVTGSWSSKISKKTK